MSKPEKKINPKKQHTITLIVDEDVLCWLQGDLMTTMVCDGIANGGQQFASLVIRAIRKGEKSVHISTKFKKGRRK